MCFVFQDDAIISIGPSGAWLPTRVKLASENRPTQVRRRGRRAAAVQGLEAFAESGWLDRIALTRLCLIEKGIEQDHRPTPDEIDEPEEFFERNARQLIPMRGLIRFAPGRVTA